MGAGTLAALLASVGLGALLATQAPINALLGRGLGSGLAAVLVSLTVSSACALALLAVSGDAPRWREPPAWLFLGGGLIGVAFVFGSMSLVPRLGAASFLSCIILGQLGAGLVLDHLGAFGLSGHDVTPGRLVAVGCILLGVVLLRVS